MSERAAADFTPPDGVELTDAEVAMLAGEHGAAAGFAMRLIVDLARVLGAESLVPVTSAHIDGCLYHGQVGVDFVETLVRLGGRVSVPTTLNVGSLDLMHPELVRLDQPRSASARRLMDGYVALGARPTWTCAPYQLAHRPARGEHVAWAESNAIVFANSVLGARTNRYGDFLDICAAIAGRAPRAGLHLDSERAGRVVFECGDLPPHTLKHDAGWAALGHLVGRRAGSTVPILDGLPQTATEDQLKALGAAAASSGGVGMFHAVGITPEAPTREDALHGAAPESTSRIQLADLVQARDELCTVASGRIDAVSVGTPHFSAAEFADLARLLDDGAPFADDVAFWVSTSRHVLEQADRAGHAAVCRAAGAHIVVDTCTYVTPILDPVTKVVMTDSAKWAWYAPSNIGVEVVFGTLAECVASARAGSVRRDPAAWEA